ncbi:putative transcription initiation factor tfiid subunit beta [Diplodia seriata]|uniref:Putative transcription initiation factor tfiid subunit beta n=1 Tax=Diplodia seriata TaxID=420778 RepID=A0A0G2GDV1_9PEZI|nr:putative transcription initiation factor tfiid subunit beta [Diplodia seriata]
MASPPSGYNLTKKRPSISGPLPPNPSKRRKPSTGPSGLRQTSFPPEESGRAEFSRSPSVDSTYTANTNTTKKKGKKGKGGGDDDVRSTTGTSVRGGKAGAGDGADKADEEEEADQEEGGEALDAVLEGQGEADEKQEKEHLRMLVDRLDPDQSDRYAKYRAVKLKKETVRKITNQTLSQSVPQSVVTTINSYTKVFIGSLIERAPVASSGTPSPAPGATPAPTTNNSGAAGNANSAQATTPSASQDTTVPASSGGTNATNNTADSNDDSDTETAKRIPADAPLSERLAERDRGPLTPDHLREALRRYKKDREGGAMGFLGLSLEGRERTAGRMGGRRLFK